MDNMGGTLDLGLEIKLLKDLNLPSWGRYCVEDFSVTWKLHETGKFSFPHNLKVNLAKNHSNLWKCSHFSTDHWSSQVVMFHNDKSST